MKVLAIFTCYNRRELTRQSMELLGQNKNVTFDYVIVNDGSTARMRCWRRCRMRSI